MSFYFAMTKTKQQNLEDYGISYKILCKKKKKNQFEMHLQLLSRNIKKNAVKPACLHIKGKKSTQEIEI